jgi:bifunctional non-homologous end joining protein LigD
MLHRRFRPLVTERPPTIDKIPGKGLVYLRPRLVAQISYQELTAGRKLRQPVFLGLRTDKAASAVTLPVAG